MTKKDFELDKDYYNIAQDRIKNHTQQLTTISKGKSNDN